MLKEIIVEFLKLKAHELKEVFKGIGVFILILIACVAAIGLICAFFIVIGFTHVQICPYVLWFLKCEGPWYGRYFEIGFMDLLFVLVSILAVVVVILIKQWLQDNWRKAVHIVTVREQRKQREKELKEYDDRYKKWKEEQAAIKPKRKTKTMSVKKKKK